MLEILKIIPLAPFSTEIKPNTIFGALCWNIFKYEGEKKLKEFLEEFKKEPIFILSSPLIYKKAKRKEDSSFQNIFFLPAPVLKGSVLDFLKEDKDEFEYIKYIYPILKLVKKIAFLPWPLYKKILDGEIKEEKDLFKEIIIEFSKMENSSSDKTNLKENLRNIAEKQESYSSFINFIKENFTKKIYSEELFVKTAINRLTKNALEGNLINEEAYFYKPFYVLIYIYNKEKWEKYKLKNYLKNVILGGNKSIGFGKTKIEFIRKDNEIFESIKDIENYIKNPTKSFITLSPFSCKNINNIDIENSCYNLEIFRGAREDNLLNIDFIASSVPIWKKTLFMFKEGSFIFLKNEKAKEKFFFGNLEESLRKGNNKIYTYSYAFPLFVQN